MVSIALVVTELSVPEAPALANSVQFVPALGEEETDADSEEEGEDETELETLEDGEDDAEEVADACSDIRLTPCTRPAGLNV